MATTNYEFITPIGSDVVNLLTQSNPNWVSLDTILKGISDRAIGTATELKTGTVHALTRGTGSEDRDTFIFIATTNFVAGETFLLDNEQVTALTASGEQLSTGCYIIGSAVLVHKKDTLLTFYVPESKAKDSDKLGGELPAHYATQSDVSDLQTDLSAVETKVGSGVLQTQAQNCVGAINELNTHLSALSVITSNETVIGKWIDNKTLYRKTIYVAGTVTSGTVIDSSITNQNIDTLVSMSGVCAHGSYYRLPIPYYSNANNYLALQIQDGGVVLSSAGFTATNVVVTVEYTK